MEYRLHIRTVGLGRDEEAGERVLTGLEQRHADLGPIVAQNTATGTLDVTIALDAPAAEEAIAEGFKAFKEGMIDAGFRGVTIDSVTAEPVPADELEPEPSVAT